MSHTLGYDSLNMDIVTGVGVLDKAMTVLRSVAVEARSLNELQESTGLPRATAHRLAAALEAHAILRRDGDGRFELGHALISLGQAADERFPLDDLARPILSTLRDETGESTQLFVQEGRHRRCVVSLETPHGLRWIVPEGSVFPLEAGSAGRVLTGETSDTGWIESVGEREAGVASVSAKVAAPDGTIIAALSVSGPIERLTEQPGARFGTAVLAAAADLARVVAR
jgi:DNA-binding IclR family transcriptional regulator